MVPGESLIPSLLDVTFRAECFPGDALTSQCVPLPDEADATAPDGFPQAPHGLLHVIRRTDSGDDVCRAVTRWTQKVRPALMMCPSHGHPANLTNSKGRFRRPFYCL